jgi:hypothetical protein
MIRRFIGDVHGKYGPYRKIMKECSGSIQVGDMGIGFKKYTEYGDWKFMPNPPYDIMLSGNHKFIRGNHDNPNSCRGHTQWIADGTVFDNMMFIGGAMSIDKEYRVQDVSWWPDEELSQAELNEIVDIYYKNGPEILVTHECPDFLCQYLNHNYKKNLPSITRKTLEGMRVISKPKVHIFGHWHKDFDMVIDDTRFICLNELSYIDIDQDDPVNTGKIVPRAM